MVHQVRQVRKLELPDLGMSLNCHAVRPQPFRGWTAAPQAGGVPCNLGMFANCQVVLVPHRHFGGASKLELPYLPYLPYLLYLPF